MAAYRDYFENFYPAYQAGTARHATPSGEAGVFCPQYARGGLGGDYLLGGCGCEGYRVIDLSALEMPVSLQITAKGAGVISDGIDSIVFQRVEEIILPSWMIDAMRPNLPACSDHGVRLRAPEDEAAREGHIAAE